MGYSPGDETNSPVIRVYDEAGNVIETHEARGRVLRHVFSRASRGSLVTYRNWLIFISLNIHTATRLNTHE
jgi:hypothetical protein